MNALPIDRQVQDLYDSRYDVRWETAKGFFSGALPALVTFGLGAAALTALVTVGAGLLTGASLAGVAGTAITTGLLFGGAVAIFTGAASGFRAHREKSERNEAIDQQINYLRAYAEEQGTELPDPKLADMHPPTIEDRSGVVEKVLREGKKTFDPGEIAKRAAQDIGLPLP